MRCGSGSGRSSPACWRCATVLTSFSPFFFSTHPTPLHPNSPHPPGERYVFTWQFFSVWVGIGFTWTWIAALVVIIWPVWESYAGSKQIIVVSGSGRDRSRGRGRGNSRVLSSPTVVTYRSPDIVHPLLTLLPNSHSPTPPSPLPSPSPSPLPSHTGCLRPLRGVARPCHPALVHAQGDHQEARRRRRHARRRVLRGLGGLLWVRRRAERRVRGPHHAQHDGVSEWLAGHSEQQLQGL